MKPPLLRLSTLAGWSRAARNPLPVQDGDGDECELAAKENKQRSRKQPARITRITRLKQNQELRILSTRVIGGHLFLNCDADGHSRESSSPRENRGTQRKAAQTAFAIYAFFVARSLISARRGVFLVAFLASALTALQPRARFDSSADREWPASRADPPVPLRFQTDSPTWLLKVEGWLHLRHQTTPSRSAWVGFTTPRGRSRCRWWRSLAYVADADAGLQIIDVSNPGRPGASGGFDTWECGYGQPRAVAGNLAVRIGWPRGLRQTH